MFFYEVQSIALICANHFDVNVFFFGELKSLGTVKA